MTVLDILILSMGFSEDGKQVLGDVKFMIDNPGNVPRGLTLKCKCEASQRIRPDALLIGDAIRQLRRMPEIRSGEQRLKFAKGLKPLRADKAA
ncbi:MAG: hypothetical protein AAF841_09215 [Pseudomonadota bacterium]